MPFEIRSVLEGLAEKRPVFHSEADFQFALAWEIRETTNLGIRLEYKAFSDESMYLDVWLPSNRIAVELKYRTAKLNACPKRESFALREQSAQDFGRYDYLSDLARLERVVAKLPEARGGLAIMLTNDPLYWDPSRRRPGTDDADFRIHEGRCLPHKMDWPDHKRQNKGKERESPIVLTDSYICKWRDYGRPVVSNANNARFRYLALEVSR